MVIKKIIKDKIIKVETNVNVCDLCEAEVSDGQSMVTIVPAINRTNADKYYGDHQETRIDICSVDCMVKNARAAGLLLNTKLIPTLYDSQKKFVSRF